MKPDLSALHAFPWNEEEDLVFNVHACYGAVSNWGGIICLGLKWLSYKTPAVSWASQEWQGKEGCSEYWGELHCGGCGAKFALASGIWNQVTAVLPSAPAAGGSCPKPSASPLQCVSEVHHRAAQSLMCVFQCTNTNEHVGGAHFPDRSFQFLRKKDFGRRRLFVLKKKSLLVLFAEVLEHL